jgi:hypothetical protein
MIASRGRHDRGFVAVMTGLDPVIRRGTVLIPSIA